MDNSKLSFTTKNDLFTDDPLVPNETRICYSKTKAVIWLIVSVAMVSSLIWLAFTDNKSYFAVVVIGTLFSYVSVNCVKHLADREPQAILNINGIRVGKLPFYEWKEIDNEEIITKIRQGPTCFLKYNSPSGVNEFYINLWDVDHRKLQKLLVIYRYRNNVKFDRQN